VSRNRPEKRVLPDFNDSPPPRYFNDAFVSALLRVRVAIAVCRHHSHIVRPNPKRLPAGETSQARQLHEQALSLLRPIGKTTVAESVTSFVDTVLTRLNSTAAEKDGSAKLLIYRHNLVAGVGFEPTTFRL
jgi:hypothetical protein